MSQKRILSCILSFSSPSLLFYDQPGQNMSQPDQFLNFYIVESEKRQRRQGSRMKESLTDGKKLHERLIEINWVYKIKRRDYGIEVSQAGEEECGWEGYLVSKYCGLWKIRKKKRDMWNIVCIYELIFVFKCVSWIWHHSNLNHMSHIFISTT